MAKEIIYRMNMTLAGFKKGDWWVKGTEPFIVTKWAELGGGVLGVEPILTIEERDPLDLGENKSEFSGTCPRCGFNKEEEKKVDPDTTDNEVHTEERICKGKKKDGSPCDFSGNRVRENGYCFMHQDQAPKEDEKIDNDSAPTEDDETDQDPEPDSEASSETGSDIFKPNLEDIIDEPEEGKS